jgi:hypothetical protein
MTFRKCRASDITLTIREKRVALNLCHNAVASASARLAPQIASGIVNRALQKALRKNNLTSAFTLPIAYAKTVLAEFQNIEIPPPQLNFRLHDWIGGDLGPQHANDYFICTGNWSAVLTDIKNSSVYLEAQQLHSAHLDYVSTEVYQRYLKQLTQGRIHTRNKIALDTPEKITFYFERFVTLFRSIQTHGFLTLEQARKTKDPLNNRSAIRTWRTNYGETNIGIAIGPQGEFINLPGGQHRLAIAAVIGLPVIPSEIRMVHIDWIKKFVNSDPENPLADIRKALNARQTNPPQQPASKYSASSPAAEKTPPSAAPARH